MLAVVRTVSDSELAAGLRRGEESSFKELFDRYHAPLYRYLLRKGVPSAAAEDILQNAFMALWERRENTDPTKSLKGYLYRTCHNRAANYFRDQGKFVIGDDGSEATVAPTQESDAGYNALQAALEVAVAMLPERRRAVFELCFIDGLTYREAAEVLGVSTKTVENQMGHALRAIRKHITPLL